MPLQGPFAVIADQPARDVVEAFCARETQAEHEAGLFTRR